MQRRRILVATSVLAAVVGCRWPRVASAQAPRLSARDAALQVLAARLHLPLLDEGTAIFSRQLRRSGPAEFVSAVGQNFGLGSQWRRGNATYDEAVRQVDVVLASEEARSGPLLKIERGDLLAAVDVPWSEADIAFVEQTLTTELGHEAERAIDAKAAQQTIATFRRQIAAPNASPDITEAFAALDARAQSQFADAFLTLLAMKAIDPQRAQRLQRLIEAVTLAPSDAIGQRVTRRLSQRLLDAAANALPQVLQGLGARGALR